MSFEDIRIHRDYAIINGFVQIPPNKPLDKISTLENSIEATALGETTRLSLGSGKDTGSKFGSQAFVRAPGTQP